MKIFKSIGKILDEAMIDIGIEKVHVSTGHKLISHNQERELFHGNFEGLYNQLPDIVTDTYRYAVTYNFHTFRDSVTTTTSYFRIFKKREVKEWYKLELTLRGEPISVTFTPSYAEDKPVCVHNSPKNRSVRFFKSEDENLYSEVFKKPVTDQNSLHNEGMCSPIKLTVVEIPLLWNKIRYAHSSQKRVDIEDTDTIKMVFDLMLETGLICLKSDLEVEMKRGNMLTLLTDGKVNKNCLLCYTVK